MSRRNDFDDLRRRSGAIAGGVVLTLVAALLAVPAGHARQIELRFTTQDFEPFNFETGGKVVGPVQEMIEIACARIKARCTSVLLPWARAQREVVDGRAHGMFVIGWNRPRAGTLHFTPPMLKTEHGFFVPGDNALDYKDLPDVQGLTVAVYGPSNTSTSLEQLRSRMVERHLRPIQIDMRPDDDAGFRKHAALRVDAVFSNREVGWVLAKRHGLSDKIRYAGKTDDLDYDIGFARRSNDSEVLAAFDAAVDGLPKDGNGKGILDKFEMQPPEVRLDSAKTMRT